MTYVDKEKNRFGRMLMCHMVADTEDELNRMADLIGVARKWLQRSRLGVLHYDICQSKRALAVRHGAVEVGRREFVELTTARRRT